MADWENEMWRKEVREDRAVRTTMERRKTPGGGWTGIAKTGSVWSVLNNNNCLYCSRGNFNVSESRRRQKYTFDLALLRPVYSSSLRNSWLSPSPLDLLGCIFWRCSLLIFRRNANRLAYIPPRFHFGFRAPPQKGFYEAQAKKYS